MNAGLVEVLIHQVVRLQQYATNDPREDVRRDAEERLTNALEAVLGMDWSTFEKMSIIAAVKDGGDPTAIIAICPELAGHEEKIRVAVDGFKDGDRRWPPLVDLLEAAGLLKIEGGNEKAQKRSRRRAADTLYSTWRKFERDWNRTGGAPHQPFGYRPPTP